MEISGFENIISIEQFEYISTVNEHERCHFVCYVREKDIDSIIKKLDSVCTYKDGNFSFAGHISELILSKDISGNRIEVNSVGKTYKYDDESHNRIYQSNEKTFSDILSKMACMSEVKYEGKQEKTIKGMLIQEGVTDWKFAVQIANMLGEHVFAGENTFIGSHGVNKINLSEEDCIDYRYCMSTAGVRMDCRIDKNLNLGDIVSYCGKELFVYQKRYILEGGQYYYEYCLCEIKEPSDIYGIHNDVLLEAVVKDNNDPDKKGRIKVSFANDNMEDCMEDKAIWIEMECFYASKKYGAVFIPSIDDKVIVKLKDGKCIVLGSVRTEAYDDVVQNQESKYIVLDENISMEYGNGCFKLINKETAISISDKEIKVNIGDKANLVIDTEKAIIKVDKSAVEIANDLRMSANGYSVEAKKLASISASNVDIKGKSGVNIN